MKSRQLCVNDGEILHRIAVDYNNSIGDIGVLLYSLLEFIGAGMLMRIAHI